MENIYAIYQGDDFDFMGTADECIDYLGVKRMSFFFMATPAYHRRAAPTSKIVIKVEDIDDGAMV